MKIFALDDNKPMLRMLAAAICEARPNSDVSEFSKAAELVEYTKENACYIAFLDIKMRGMTGLDVAKRLKDINPKTNITFVTGYPKNMGEAFTLYPSGYVLKPATKEKVERELENLRHPIDKKVKQEYMYRPSAALRFWWTVRH